MIIKTPNSIFTMKYYHFLLVLFSLNAFSQDTELPKITINTGSFLYHVVPSSAGSDYTQYFDNEFLAVGVRITEKTYFSFGTSLNSFGDRMAVIGFRTVLHRFNDKIYFEGFYAYAGEFFFSEFSHAGDQGIYKEIKDKTGIGFAPYIYHGFDFKINSFLTLEAGVILPIIPVATLQIDLF